MTKSRIGVAMDVLSGTGAAAQLGNSLRERSVKRAVVVTGHHTETLPIFKAISDGLNEAGIAWTQAAREHRHVQVRRVPCLAIDSGAGRSLLQREPDSSDFRAGFSIRLD